MKTKHPKTGIHPIIYDLQKEAKSISLTITQNLHVFYT